ncbi:hypothetical protein D9M72_624860 [compost metagenome]
MGLDAGFVRYRRRVGKRVTIERRVAGCHFKQHDGGGISFRRGIEPSPEPTQEWIQIGRGAGSDVRCCSPGKREVEEYEVFAAALCPNAQVAWLDVSVINTVLVQLDQCFQEVPAESFQQVQG